jgi:hypothetical protein
MSQPARSYPKLVLVMPFHCSSPATTVLISASTVGSATVALGGLFWLHVRGFASVRTNRSSNRVVLHLRVLILLSSNTDSTRNRNTIGSQLKTKLIQRRLGGEYAYAFLASVTPHIRRNLRRGIGRPLNTQVVYSKQFGQSCILPQASQRQQCSLPPYIMQTLSN